MNTNFRALTFGSVITAAIVAALTITIGNVAAAEPVPVIRLDAVQVTGHRDNFDVDGNLKVTRLEKISVIAHKSSFVAV